MSTVDKARKLLVRLSKAGERRDTAAIIDLHESLAERVPALLDHIEKLEARLDKSVPKPNGVSIWYMYDGHWFHPLEGTTLDELIEDANRLRKGPEGAYGMLCPAILTKDSKELRRLKVAAHAGKPGKPEDDKKWREACEQWKVAHVADPEVMALIAAGKVYKREDKTE